MIGAGRDKKEDAIDPAVGIILEVKVRRESGRRLGAVPPLLHQGRPRGRGRRNGGGRLPHLRAEARRARTDSGSRRRRWAASPACWAWSSSWRVAWLFSTHKRAIKLRIIAWGLGLQFAFALLVLKTDFGKIFQAIGVGVNAMLGYTEAGSEFVFGPLGKSSGPFGVLFAFQVLPIIIFIASFFSILYYLGIMQWVVRGMAIVMQKVMGVSGAESLNVAASIFMGQTEAPLTIRPFLAGLTESELFTIMTSGMAHVSGSVMAAYVKIAGVAITHLLTAVIMTAPATIMLAKIFVPETEKPATAGKVEIKVEKTAVNVIDAAAQGAGDGLHLALNVAGMLIAFLALIAMVQRHPGLGAQAAAAWAGCRLRWNRSSAWSSRRWRG